MRPTESEVSNGARAYLEHMIARARERFGKTPRREQISMWMVPTGPGSMSGKEFKREVVDTIELSSYCQSIMRDSFPEQARLTDLVVAAGIRKEEMRFAFLLPLVHHWLDTVDPLSPTEDEFRSLLADFCEAVLARRVVARRPDALELNYPARQEVRLDDNVIIRSVTAEELWQLGDRSEIAWWGAIGRNLTTFLSEDLMIVDIAVTRPSRPGDQSLEINVLSETTLIGLRLLAGGFFRTVSLGQWMNYGFGALGKSFQGGGLPQGQGMGGGPYVLDAASIRRLRTAWPDIRRIVASDRDYLRLPAQKLLEGGRRIRDEDAVIDYSIGLESLLISDLRQELSYRFALRGATIQCWAGGDRMSSFNSLKGFYNVRSRIVHGDRVEQEKLTEARQSGEAALRNIWWWYFENVRAGLDAGTALVDNRIC